MNKWMNGYSIQKKTIEIVEKLRLPIIISTRKTNEGVSIKKIQKKEN